MAVRFDASGESYNRTLSLGSQTAFSVTMWAKLSVDRAAQTVFWQVDDNGVSPYLTVQCLDGTGLGIESNSWGAFSLSHTLTVGTWCFIGVAAHTDGNINTVIGNASSTLQGATWGAGAGTITANRLVLGTGGLASQYLNGCLAAVKVWSGVRLSQDELKNEAYTYLPARTSGLRAWYPFLRAETVDYGGLAQTLSGGTGTTTEDGPPIAWGPGRRRTARAQPVPATGPLAAALPALTVAGAGNATASASTAATLPSLAAAAAATAKTAGALTAGLPALQASFAAAGQGGFLVGTLPALTGTSTGTAKTGAALAGTLPALTGSLTAFEVIPDYDITLTAGPIVRAWNGSQPQGHWTVPEPAAGWTGLQPR